VTTSPTEGEDEAVYGEVVVHHHTEASRVIIEVKQTITEGQRDHWVGAHIEHSVAPDEDFEELVDYTIKQTIQAAFDAGSELVRRRSDARRAAQAARAQQEGTAE
jgi:hypothetical protein